MARSVLAIGILNIPGDSLMDVTSSTPAPKRTKAKPKVEVAPKKESTKKAAASTPVKVKKARIAPAAVAAKPIETVATTVEVVSTSGLTLTDLQHEIAMAAYFLAEHRNFAPGHELDDWLQAERLVRETRAV
jgi:Protein of unknown function (DUF2934)